MSGANVEPAEDTRIALLTAQDYLDAGAEPGTYKVAAVDAAGNRGSFATVGPQGTLDATPVAFRFALGGVHPNPARSVAVVLDLSLDGRAGARLEVLDLSGRRVFVRDLADVAPGRHQLPLVSGRRLPPGLYLARLTDGRDEAQVSRFVVLE